MRRRKQRQYSAVADINIANLVDVTLVLLIIFMISAPLLQSGIEIDLPKTRAAALSDEAQGVIVTVDSKGGIYIDDIWCRLENLEETLEQSLRDKGVADVYLRSDSTVAYGTVVDVLARMKEMGVEGIGLVTAKIESN